MGPETTFAEGSRNLHKQQIRVHIDELRVAGISPSDRERFGDAFRGELARLVATRGLSASRVAGSSDYIDAGEIQVGSRPAARSVAIQAARAVYGNLSKGGR
jgi:hypothetical protein